MEGGLSGSNSFTESTSTSTFCGKKYVCECGLDAILKTSLTYQNMGRRFWGCPKFEARKPYNFFQFVDGDEVIDGRARDVLLRFKDKQVRFEKENQRNRQENANLIAEKGKLLQKNADLMSKNGKLLDENGKLLQENGDLKVQCEAFVKKIKGLEKKVKKSEKICGRALKSCQIFCVVSIVCLLVSVFIGLYRLH